jgi:glutaredoxin
MFCGKVKEFLSQNKIEFVDRNITADEAALMELEKLGYMTTPVTVILRRAKTPNQSIEPRAAR